MALYVYVRRLPEYQMPKADDRRQPNLCASSLRARVGIVGATVRARLLLHADGRVVLERLLEHRRVHAGLVAERLHVRVGPPRRLLGREGRRERTSHCRVSHPGRRVRVPR